jgi:hypothetical protein
MSFGHGTIQTVFFAPTRRPEARPNDRSSFGITAPAASLRSALWVALALAGATLGCSGCGAREARVVAMQTPHVEVETNFQAPAVVELAPVETPEVELAPVVAEVELAPVVVELPSVVRTDRFFDTEDAPIRLALATENVAQIENGFAGRSLGFRVTLEDGTRGYFKPEQTFSGTNLYAEIAAYHLDRELGFYRTAASVERRLDWAQLRAVAGNDARVNEVIVGDDGMVTGSFVYWVPERLVALRLPENWEEWMRIEGHRDAITPFQRPGAYARAVAAGERRPFSGEAPEPDIAERPAQLSDLIVFDYLIQNMDRWSENSTNVRTVGEGGPIMFLDNSAAFTLGAPHVSLSDRRLAHVQRFRRSTIDAVRNLDVASFEQRLIDDPNAPELSARQIRNLETRRQLLIAHVDALIAEHGEEAVYSF